MYIADRVHNSISRIWLPAVVLGGWVATSGAFLEDYVSVVQNADDPLIAIGASLAIAWINFAALFAAYHMVSFLSSVCVRRRRRTISLDDTDHSPPVALFYLCMNDFNESAFRSCIDLDYTHWFILETSKVRRDAMKELYNMNITPYSLFPGVDGLARSLAYELESHWAFDPITMKTREGFFIE